MGILSIVSWRGCDGCFALEGGHSLGAMKAIRPPYEKKAGALSSAGLFLRSELYALTATPPMFLTIAWPNSEHLIFVAPVIWRSKS